MLLNRIVFIFLLLNATCILLSGSGLVSEGNNVVRSGRLLSKSFYPDETGISSGTREIGEAWDGSILFSSDRALIRFDGLVWETMETGSDFSAFDSIDESNFIYSRQGNIWELEQDEMGRAEKTNLTQHLNLDEWMSLEVTQLVGDNARIVAFTAKQLLILKRDSGNSRIVNLGGWSSGFCLLEDKAVVFGDYKGVHACFVDLESGAVTAGTEAFNND